MLKVKNIEFADSIGVMYAIKEANNLKTLQDTFTHLQKCNDLDNILEVLRVSYNAQNKTNISFSEFIEIIEKEELGYLCLIDAYQKLLEKLMYAGLTPEEVQAKTNFLKNLKSQEH